MLEGATSKVLVADATISGQEERLAGGEERQPGVLVSPNDMGEHHSRLTRWEKASLPLRVSFVKLSLTFDVCCHALFIYA